MALTDDFSYRLTETGIILNPDSLVTPFVDLTEMRGFDSAPIRTTERDHEGTDGGFMDAEFEKGRPISLEGMAYADGLAVESFLDDLKANWAPRKNVVPLYFKKPGIDERFFWVKPLGCRYDVTTFRRLGQTEIQFQAFAEDPRAYSSNVIEETITQAEPSLTGRGYNKEYSYSYGIPVDPSSKNVVVGGNRPTPAELTIYGPALQPMIVNETKGLTLHFDLTLAAGDTMVVNTYYHTVRVNGVNRRSSLVSPNWFYLEPGDNIITYRSQMAGGSYLIVRTYSAWR